MLGVLAFVLYIFFFLRQFIWWRVVISLLIDIIVFILIVVINFLPPINKSMQLIYRISIDIKKLRIKIEISNIFFSCKFVYA